MNAPQAWWQSAGGPSEPQIPHATQSEQMILGGLMIDARSFDQIADVVRERDFCAAHHRVIFRAIAELVEQGQFVDAVTVYEALGRPANGDAGDLPYLTELTNTTPGIATIRRHAEIVRRTASLRELMAIGADLQRTANEPLADVRAIVANAEAALMAATDRDEGGSVSIAEAVDEVITHLADRDERGATGGDLRTGIQGLDRLLGGGITPGALILIGSRPSMGKTSLGCTIADGLAAAGHSVYVHSLEVTRREITMKVMALRTGISTMAMRASDRGQDVYAGIVRERVKAEDQKFFIDDKPAITVGYLRAKARKLQRKHGLHLIVIDYLGLMRGAGDNRTQEIGSITRGLKALAKELSVPIILLAQLNRGLESRTDKRPMLADLRDSGEIEQDADVVAMLHRESAHSDDPEWAGLAELLVRKNRNGPTGECLLHFDATTGAFTDAQRASPRIRSVGAVRVRGLS